MSIDWSSEPYVRLFKKDTDDDLLLSWEARAVWYEFLKKCDRSGVLETKRGVRGFAAQVRIPLDVVERVLPELLEDGRLRCNPQVGFVAPNYMEANDTPRSDRARQAESRARRRLTALTGENHGGGTDPPSHGVTLSHDESQPVTQIRSDQGRSVQGARARSAPISDSWQPSESERDLARKLGLDVDAEAEEFRRFWLGDGREKSNWDHVFASRLMAQAKRKRDPVEQPREIPEL